MTRTRLVATAARWAAALFLVALAASAMAQEKYPSRPVTLVVPQAPGGANDAIARIVAQKLTEQLGQQFIVDNRPGAGGNIGTAAAAKARPDGYTLLLTVNSAHVINPALYKSTGFDPVKDFEPVTPVATAGYVLVANNSFPARNVAEMVTVAKTQPGRITIASAGNGTLNHLIGEMLQRATGIELVHVPYKGAAPATTDIVGGQIPVAILGLGAIMPHIRSGRLRGIAVLSAQRSAALPDVPTLYESGIKFDATQWYGILTTAGTPAEVIAQVQAAIRRAAADAGVRERLIALGGEPTSSTPEEYAALIRSETEKFAKVIKDANIKAD